MSLKVLGKWKRWGKSMDSKFLSIQTNLQRNHTHAFHEPSPTSTTSKYLPTHPNIAKVMDANRRDNSPVDTSENEDPDVDEDEDDGPLYDSRVPIQFNEREMEVIRKVMRKWWRVTGLSGSPKLCDELGGAEFQVNWTKAIAPRLEGRIKEIGPGVKPDVS